MKKILKDELNGVRIDICRAIVGKKTNILKKTLKKEKAGF